MSIEECNWRFYSGRSKVHLSRRVVASGKYSGSGVAAESEAGLRLIYYWDKDHETVYMLFVYPKSDQEDLTPSQLKTLRKLVREELK